MRPRHVIPALIAAACGAAPAFGAGSSSTPGWPTVYTNSPRIGIYYNWEYPQTFTPYGPGAPYFWQDIPHYWPPGVGQAPLTEVVRRVDPELVAPATPPTPPAPLSLEELATEALRACDFAQAVPLCARLALEAESSTGAPDRATWKDLWILALAGAGQFDQGALLHEQSAAQRAASPPPLGARLVGSPLRMREIVTRAVAWAHRNPSPRAWRFIAFLMELDDRATSAQRMRERAAALESPTSPPPTSPGAAAHAPEPDVPGPARFYMPAPAQSPPPTTPDA